MVEAIMGDAACSGTATREDLSSEDASREDGDDGGGGEVAADDESRVGTFSEMLGDSGTCSVLGLVVNVVVVVVVVVGDVGVVVVGDVGVVVVGDVGVVIVVDVGVVIVVVVVVGDVGDAGVDTACPLDRLVDGCDFDGCQRRGRRATMHARMSSASTNAGHLRKR